MNILLTGASGLIGSALLTRLLSAGHTVRAVCRHTPAQTHPALHWQAADMNQLRNVDDWLPLLRGIDCVINTVGIYSETPQQSFAVLHTQAPIALFMAATQLGVARVVQLSALGAAPRAATAYWRSKGEADAALMSLPCDSRIVRPSLVYADSGVSSTYFRQLAALPLLAVPADTSPLQPVHLDDLVDLLLLATDRTVTSPQVLEVVGPETLSLAAYLQTLRTGMGMAAARTWSVPYRLCERVATLAPKGSLLSRDSLQMLRDNPSADPHPARQLLGRPLHSPSRFAGPHLRAAAVIDAWQIMLRGALAFVWFWTVWASWQSADTSLQLLADSGLPTPWQWPALCAGIGLDLLFGILTLTHPHRRLWQAQLSIVLAYTAYISLTLPALWLHPFGPISKNLPILAVLGLLAALSPDSRKAR